MPQIRLLAAGPAATSPNLPEPSPHVLFVVDGFPKALGGGERIVLRLAALLPLYGYRASILTLSLHPESAFLPEEAPCPVYLLPITKTYGLDALRGALSLRRFLRDQNISVVQTFFESSDLWGGVVTRLLSSAKLVWSRRDMGILRDRKHAVAYRALRHLPHAVHAVSNRVAGHVVSVDGVPSERVRVIYNGLDLGNVPRNPPQRSDSPVITTIGNIRRVKGHDVLLKAAPAVLARFPNALFTIAGEVLEPEYFAELTKQVDTLGLGQSFRFLGKVSDLQKHLETASVFVLPSRSEGFSNALIEAMSLGLPSIATDVGGNAEAIQHGLSGLIIAPDDAAALSAAILELLEDPSKAEGLSVGARHAVEEKFTADAMLRGLVSMYQNLPLT